MRGVLGKMVRKTAEDILQTSPPEHTQGKTVRHFVELKKPAFSLGMPFLSVLELLRGRAHKAEYRFFDRDF